MKRLVESGLLRDIGIFAGAAISVHVASKFRKPLMHPLLEKYPQMRDSELIRPLIALAEFCDLADMESVIEECLRFQEILRQNNVTQDGFEVNRLATRIPNMIQDIVKRHLYDQRLETAVKAMDFERDELLTLNGLCDNMVRNMLLERQY